MTDPTQGMRPVDYLLIVLVGLQLTQMVQSAYTSGRLRGWLDGLSKRVEALEHEVKRWVKS